MELLNRIKEQARTAKQRIVLPEGNEERTMRAANEIAPRKDLRGKMPNDSFSIRCISP